MKKYSKNLRKLGLVLGFPLLVALIVTFFYRETVKKEFIEDKSDLIRVTSPAPNEVIIAPFTVTGEARGYWFFEASFSVELFDNDGNRLSIGIASANEDWMTEDFVPFEAPIFFSPPTTDKGKLILIKDNPSDIRELDDQLEIPIRFR